MRSTWALRCILCFWPLPEPPFPNKNGNWGYGYIFLAHLCPFHRTLPKPVGRLLVGSQYYDPGLLFLWKRKYWGPMRESRVQGHSVSQWQSWDQTWELDFKTSAMLIPDFTPVRENSTPWCSSKDLRMPGKVENVRWESWLVNSICAKGQGFGLPGRVYESTLW